MTGFGRFQESRPEWTQSWEVRSVNSRYLDLKWRLPHFVRALEMDFEKVVRRHASRGRVEVSLFLDVARPELMGVRLNQTLAGAMIAQMGELAASLSRTFEPDLNRLMNVPGLWTEGGAEPDPGLAESLAAGLNQAMASWDRSRAVEGADLARDIRGRVARMAELKDLIAARVPAVLEEKRRTLSERMAKVLEAAGMDEKGERVLAEAGLLADRLDVSEELTRLTTHLARLDETLVRDGDKGKRLDFLVQEAFREINTCGNKAQDVEVSGYVVEFKGELEKCREQVQNIE
jgi:uncharacterized protein (TIGR00255 family)